MPGLIYRVFDHFYALNPQYEDGCFDVATAWETADVQRVRRRAATERYFARRANNPTEAEAHRRQADMLDRQADRML